MMLTPIYFDPIRRSIRVTNYSLSQSSRFYRGSAQDDIGGAVITGDNAEEYGIGESFAALNHSSNRPSSPSDIIKLWLSQLFENTLFNIVLGSVLLMLGIGTSTVTFNSGKKDDVFKVLMIGPVLTAVGLLVVLRAMVMNVKLRQRGWFHFVNQRNSSRNAELPDEYSFQNRPRASTAPQPDIDVESQISICSNNFIDEPPPPYEAPESHVFSTGFASQQQPLPPNQHQTVIVNSVSSSATEYNAHSDFPILSPGLNVMTPGLSGRSFATPSISTRSSILSTAPASALTIMPTLPHLSPPPISFAHRGFVEGYENRPRQHDAFSAHITDSHQQILGEADIQADPTLHQSTHICCCPSLARHTYMNFQASADRLRSPNLSSTFPCHSSYSRCCCRQMSMPSLLATTRLARSISVPVLSQSGFSSNIHVGGKLTYRFQSTADDYCVTHIRRPRSFSS